MKLFWVLLAIVGFFTAIISAHPANAVTAAYDQAKKELSVTVAHSVQNPANHYISTIEVYVDGVKMISQDLKSQFNGTDQLAVYTLIDVKKGSKIKITTVCNKGGNKNTEITI